MHESLPMSALLASVNTHMHLLYRCLYTPASALIHTHTFLYITLLGNATSLDPVTPLFSSLLTLKCNG